MINNFKLIEPLLYFPNPGDSFYFLQILQRKKDFLGERLGGSNNNSRLIKAYYLNSAERFEMHKEEIIKLCDVFGARASINLNPRSFEKAGFQVMVKIANQMCNKDFYSIRKAYDSICGEHHHETDRRWIIDIDDQDQGKVTLIKNFIEGLQLEIKDRVYKVLAIVPSKSGFHLITNPFNVAEFRKLFPDIEIHKNNPTNLYIP